MTLLMEQTVDLIAKWLNNMLYATKESISNKYLL